MGRPIAVLVGGAAGSGKTTLANLLAAELHILILRADDVRDALLLTHGSRPSSELLHEVFYSATSGLLDLGISCILDKSWHRGLSEPDVELAVLNRARVAYIHCECSDAPRRFIERIKASYPGESESFYAHAESDAASKFEASSIPMDLTVPLLRVATDRGYAPNLGAIVSFIP